MIMIANHDKAQGYSLARLFEGLLEGVSLPHIEVQGLSQDSRKLQPGWLFLACAGQASHGLDHLEQALAKGAVAVAVEAGPRSASIDPDSSKVPMFVVPGLSGLLSEIAGRFYAHPSHEMQLIGITGTNGKTSVSQFIAHALSADAPCGVVGTLGCGIYGRLQDTGHTTPDAITLQAELAAMRDAGVRQAALEVSSHALVQGRVAALRFAVAVYTNLSHEHLDYHGDMQSYAAAKHRLLAMPGVQHGVINVDDAIGRAWLEELPEAMSRWRYGLEGGSGATLPHELLGSALKLGRDGLQMQVQADGEQAALRSPLLGRFNAANLLAALGALRAMGTPLAQALHSLAGIRMVAGRMEGFGGQHGRALVVVDYAHTPDALAKVLEALREHTGGRLWCVFGCGGERDQQKRPKMGAIAEALADSVIITDDNPRREDPYTIIEHILSGMSNPDAVYVNRERAAAIAHAIALSRPEDVILVAGKGHEREQQIGAQRLAFSDRDEVARLLGERVRHG